VTATSLRLSILDLVSLHRERNLSDIYAGSWVSVITARSTVGCPNEPKE